MQDVVAILRADTSAQVIAGARPMRASVYEGSRVMEHPVETGSLEADHVVSDPTEIDMPVMVTDQATWEELRQLYDDRTLLTIQTKRAVYTPMVLMEMPHEDTAAVMDKTPVNLRLRRVVFVSTVYTGLAPAKVANKAQASTVKKGAQQTTKASPAQEAKAAPAVKPSLLYKFTR